MPETNHGKSRRKLTPQERMHGVTHKGTVQMDGGELDYYLTLGFFADGTPGEVFIKIAKQGSDLAGWVSAWAQLVSINWQYGVPWEVHRSKFIEPEIRQRRVRALASERHRGGYGRTDPPAQAPLPDAGVAPT